MKSSQFYVAIALTGLAMAPSDAWACWCSYIDPEHIYKYGDLIAEGTVLSEEISAEHSCSEAAFELTEACPDQADSNCRAPYLERLEGCVGPLPLSYPAIAKVSLTGIWKGPPTKTITLRHLAGASSACAINLTPGQQIALIAHRTDSGGWSTDMCDVGPAGSFSRTDNEFGAVAHPLLVAYRAEGEEIAKRVAADPDSIEIALALAAYQEKGGHVDLALATYRDITTQAPQTKAAYLAMIRLLMAKPKLWDALDVAREGLAHIRDDPDLVKFLTDRGFKPKK